MDSNYFVMRDQYIFICYKDIIKMVYPVMLKELINNYYEDLSPYLELDKIKDYDIYNLERLCVERITKNPLTYIKKPDCPEETCDLLLDAFEDEFIDMYTKSRLSDFGAKLYNVCLQQCVKGIYIYVDRPIDQIPYDCKVYFEAYESKVKYVSGDFIEVIKQLPHRPTVYMLNDVDYIQDLIDAKLIEYTEIMVAELGYNYEIDDDYMLRIKGGYEDLMEKEIFKLAMFPVVSLEKKHFTNLTEADIR